MAADEKRTETVSFKVTERMLLDLVRLAALDDRSLSEYLFLLARERLYGDVVRLGRQAAQATSSTK